MNGAFNYSLTDIVVFQIQFNHLSWNAVYMCEINLWFFLFCPLSLDLVAPINEKLLPT